MLELLRAVLARRLDPAARLLLGQMVMYTGIAAVFPVAPLYVRQHGGGSVAVALFIAGPMVANMLIQVPAGHLTDRIGRKPVLIVSRLLYVGLSLGLFLNLGPLWLLACFRCGQGFTSGAYVPALQAALADITPNERRGERYAQLQAVEMVGLLVGPAIGGVIALWTYSAIFLCSGLASLIGVTALFRLPETRTKSTEAREARGPSGWWRTKDVIVPSLGLLAAGTLFAMYDTVWPQYLAARHVGTVLIGISVSAFALPVLLLATTAGRLSDRTNRRLLVAAAFLVVATTASLYPELRSYPVILFVGLIEAGGFMIVEPTLYAVLSSATRADVRGRAMGVGGLFQFAGGAFGAGFLGSLFGVSERLPFFGGAGACVAAAILSATMLPSAQAKAGPATGAPQLKTVDLEHQA